MGIKCDTLPPQGVPTLDNTISTTISTVTVIAFHDKQLSGTLPYELAYFQNSLLDISMFDNSISGSLKNIYPLQNLQWLDLGKNKLNGQVEVHHFPQLKYLYLNDNELTGKLIYYLE